MFLPTGLASLLLVLLAAVPPSSDAAPLPLPSSFDPLYLSIIPTASVINDPSEPPPRQATRSADKNGMGGFAVAAVAASSSTLIPIQQVASTVIATVYESRIVTATISMVKPSVESQVQQQQVVPSVASSSQIVAFPTPSSPAPSTLASTSLPPPSPSIIVVTQTVTLPPPQPSSAVPLVDAAVQPSLAPSPLPLTRTDPQLTPVFPTTTWAQPATYSDLSSFKIKKFAVGKENFQVVQGIPAWASQGYVAPSPPVATPPSSVPPTTPDAPAEQTPAPAATEAPGLLDGLLGALGRRGRVSPSHPHSRRSLSSYHHHLSLPLVHSSSNHQTLIARSPPTTLSSPAFAWDNLTSSAMQVLFPSGSANPSATPVGGGDFYATPYDFSSVSNMTLEYSVFFPLGFDFVKGGKLPGLYGGKEGCSGGDSAEDCWSSRMMWRKEGKGEIYLYVPKDKQTPRLCSTPPQSVCDSTYGLSIGRGSFSFKTGGWTTVRQDIWMNTPGLNDGGFNIFIDGNFIFSANDVLYRNAPAPVTPPAPAPAPAPAPVSPSDPTTSAPSSDDSSTLSKRYDDGFYHPNPSLDDGKYHPGVLSGQSVQSEEEDPSSVASAVPQDTNSSLDGEQTWEQTEGQEHSDEVKSPASYAEDQPASTSSSNVEDQPSSSSNSNAAEESFPSPSPTEESAPSPPAWTPSDQEIPAPPPSPIEAPSSSSSSPLSDFTPSSSGGSSLATDDGNNEESSESDQEEQTEQDASDDSTTSDNQEVSSMSQQDDTSAPPSSPSPLSTPPASDPTTTPPTLSPTTLVPLNQPSPSAEAISPPPPPPTNDPEQSPSPEPVPTPGDNTDEPMLGFTGIFFSTFFGGHGADWASPSDQDVWFSGFSVRVIE